MNQADHAILASAEAVVPLDPIDSVSSDKNAKAGGLPWMGAWVVVISLAAIVNAGMVFAGAGSRGYFVPALAAMVCVLAAIFDAFTLRIPNHITYIAALLGLAINAAVPLLHWLGGGTAVTWLGAPGLTESLLGFAACLVLGVFGNLLAGVHGGDLKLLAAMGALLGLSLVGQTLLLALMLALAYAIVNLAVLGRLNWIVRIGSQRALEFFFFRRFHTPAPDSPVTAASHIPMAIPMALGMLINLYLQARHGTRGGWF